MNDADWVIVTDLKQYAYCPRVVFYERCLPNIRPRTYKMDAGQAEHERERSRAARRTLSKYGLPDGKRHFDVDVENDNLGLRGIIDEVVETPDGLMYPVDYKMAKRVSRNHRLQLTAYALLLEDDTKPITQGYIYLTLKRQLIPIEITKKLKETIYAQINAMRHMIAQEQMPEPTSVRNRCVTCEFRRFCNDVS